MLALVPNSDEPIDELRHLPRLHVALAALVALATVAVALPVYAGWQALAHAEPRGLALADGAIGPPSSAGWLFLVGGLTVVALGVALSAALILSGRAIAARRRHGFCLVTSFVATFFFPFGTLLGFHTIHALTAPAAREAFGVRRGAAIPTPPGPSNG